MWPVSIVRSLPLSERGISNSISLSRVSRPRLARYVCDDFTFDLLGDILDGFAMLFAVSFATRDSWLHMNDILAKCRNCQNLGHTFRRPRLAVVGMYNSAETMNSRGESDSEVLLGFWSSMADIVELGMSTGPREGMTQSETISRLPNVHPSQHRNTARARVKTLAMSFVGLVLSVPAPRI